MPFLRGFCNPDELRAAKQGSQPNRDAGERVDSTLLAIDDADRGPAGQPCLPERLDRRDRSPARGDDVLDEADAFPRLEEPFEAVARPVALRLLADDQVRQPRGERGGGRKRHGAKLRPGEPNGCRLVLSYGLGDPVAQRPEQVGPRLEAVLVQVVTGAPARTEHEVSLQVGVLAQRGTELFMSQWLGRCHLWVAGVRQTSQGGAAGGVGLEKYEAGRGRGRGPWPGAA